MHRITNPSAQDRVAHRADIHVERVHAELFCRTWSDGHAMQQRQFQTNEETEGLDMEHFGTIGRQGRHVHNTFPRAFQWILGQVNDASTGKLLQIATHPFLLGCSQALFNLLFAHRMGVKQKVIKMQSQAPKQITRVCDKLAQATESPHVGIAI